MDRPPGEPLRTAAVGGLAFTILYLAHRLLQGNGPDTSTAAAVRAGSTSQRSDQRARRAGRPGRPLGFARERYRAANVVERCFNRLEQFRAVATRYDKRAVNYRAMVVIASLLIWPEG